MLLLLAFALVAGIGAAFSPCVLPVLPLALSAGRLGTGLGFVYAPCAGPILAGVVTVSAAQDFTAGRLAVGRHELRLELDAGVSGYAFTFG